MSDIKDILKSVAPTLATLLAGPEAGVAVSALESALGLTPGSGIDAVNSAMNAGLTGDQIVAIKKADLEHEERLAQTDADQVVAVNATMQQEAKAGGWFAGSWRSACGWSFALYIASAWALPLFYIQPIQLSPDLVMALGAILGIHTWHQGVAEVKRAG